MADLFETREDGDPLLSERDESTIIPGLFLCVPIVRHVLMYSCRPLIQWLTPSALWREARGTLKQFFLQAVPICVVASALARRGVLDFCSSVLGPVAAILNLPAESALPVVLASVRNDGIFLFAAENLTCGSESVSTFRLVRTRLDDNTTHRMIWLLFRGATAQ